MKTKLCSITAGGLLLVGLVVFTSCSSSSTPPPPPVGSASISYTKGVPGGVVVQTFKTTGTVASIDLLRRRLTLLGSTGKEFVVRVSTAAVNFEDLRIGHRINATVTQRILVSLQKEGVASGDEPVAGTSPAVETFQLTGRVLAIDPETRTATLQFEDGTTEIVKVREDVDLTQRRVGEQMVFRVTEMTAIWVEKRW